MRAVHKMTEALGVRDAAAIVGNHGANIGAAGQIFDRFPGFKPSRNAAPGKRGHADAEDERAFRKVLGNGGPCCRSNRPARIADEPHGDVGANGKTAQLQLGFDWP